VGPVFLRERSETTNSQETTRTDADSFKQQQHTESAEKPELTRRNTQKFSN
jgi:hypothetical protein